MRGAEGLAKAGQGGFDAMILDLMLPDIDGVDICSTLRENGNGLPILVLSARDTTDDRITGLDAGADDYLVKPFAFDEVLARLRALLRRQRPLPPPPPAFRLDPESKMVEIEGRAISLTHREYRLLDALYTNANKVVSRLYLLNEVWGEETGVTENTVDVYIGYLRRKIDGGRKNSRIMTVRGLGFRLSL